MRSWLAPWAGFAVMYRFHDVCHTPAPSNNEMLARGEQRTARKDTRQAF